MYIGNLQIHACGTGVVANGAHMTIDNLTATATPVVFDFTNGGSVDLGNAYYDANPDAPLPTAAHISPDLRSR
jgi:hypothetical protein